KMTNVRWCRIMSSDRMAPREDQILPPAVQSRFPATRQERVAVDLPGASVRLTSGTWSKSGVSVCESGSGAGLQRVRGRSEATLLGARAVVRVPPRSRGEALHGLHGRVADDRTACDVAV